MVVRIQISSPSISRRNDDDASTPLPQLVVNTSSNNNPKHKRRYFVIGLLIGMMIMSLLSEFFGNNMRYTKNQMLLFATTSSSTSSTTKASQQQLQRQQRMYDYFTNYHYIQPIPKDHLGHMKPSPNHYPHKDCGPILEDSGSPPDFAAFFKLDQNQRSRLNEDKFIYETIFKKHHPNNGGPSYTFVELGAFNGAKESNTMFFEKCLGWEGLLIEGNPLNYQSVLQNRPYAHKMSFAPSCAFDNTTIEFYRYPMTNVGLVGHAKTYEGKPTVDVPCGPLGPVLHDIFIEIQLLNNNNSTTHQSQLLTTTSDLEEDNNNNALEQKPTINFFSLDVEGAEFLVLQTIDFDAVNIWVLMIEIQNQDCQGPSCQVRKQVRSIMSQNNYQRYEGLVHASDIYVHPNSPYQIPTDIAKPKE